MNEAALTKKMVRRLRSEGAFVAKIHGGPQQATGLPDIVGCIEEEQDPDAFVAANGMFFGIEVKMPGKERTLTPRQKYKLEMIQEAGGRCGVATTVAQALSIAHDNPDMADEPLYDWENHGDG